MSSSGCFIESYVHNGGIGVLIELRLSNSFVMKSDLFTGLAKDLAMHIAAIAPTSVEDLLEQSFVKDLDITVKQLITRVAGDLREKIAVVRFVRWSTDQQESLQPEPPRSPAVIYDLRKAK